MNLTAVPLKLPAEGNLVMGHSHFIKTAEDLAEIAAVVPGAKFGVAFCEASGPCLIRADGNDAELIAVATANAESVAAGHTFFLALRGAFPITMLNAVKACPEVCTIHCATGNPVQAIVAETEQGRGVLGVIDGAPPKGIEDAEARDKRREFLRAIGYKR